MNIAISYKKSERLHYVLRAIPREELAWDPSAGCAEHLNALLSAKSQVNLLEAIDKMPSLYPGGMFGGERYAHELPDAGDVLADFAECDEEQLEAESQIAASVDLRANVSRLTKLLNSFGTSGPRYAATLSYLDGGKCVLLAERLQDWMMLHSSLSICARLRAQLEDPDGEVSLEAAGFTLAPNRLLGDDYYIAPFKFNTFYAHRSKDAGDDDPLFAAAAPVDRGEFKLARMVTLPVWRPLGAGGGVFFTTAPIATQSLPEDVEKLFVARRRKASDKTYYLLARDAGSQKAVAESVASALTAAFRNLRDPGTRKGGPGPFLGWEYDEADEYRPLPCARLVPRSLPSALFHQLVYHPGMHTIACETCGNAVLAQEKGMHRLYCSNSCRVQAAVRARKAREE